MALALVLAVGLSLAADAALVAIGTQAVPAHQGLQHFKFSDYARLTVIGIIIAWPPGRW